MQHSFLTTERLLLRPFTLSDTAFILELLNTETWLRFIGDPHVHTEVQAVEYLEKGPLKSYAEHGFGLSMVALKEGAVPIGMCGLLKRDQLDFPDIGFALLPQYTGQGYAYEAASGTLEEGFSRFGLETVLAITDPENSHSVKLLEKLGMQYQRRVLSADGQKELLMYAVKKPEQ